MTWKGETQRHSMAARGIRTGQYLMNTKGQRVQFRKTTRGGVLQIPTPTDAKMKELFNIEEKLINMGISWDTGYIVGPKVREWLLDGGQGFTLINNKKTVDLVFDLQYINITELSKVERRLKELGVKMNVDWQPENDKRIWRFGP